MTTIRKISATSMFDINGITVAQLIEFLQGIEDPENTKLTVNNPVFDVAGEFMYTEEDCVADIQVTKSSTGLCHTLRFM